MDQKHCFTASFSSLLAAGKVVRELGLKLKETAPMGVAVYYMACFYQTTTVLDQLIDLRKVLPSCCRVAILEVSRLARNIELYFM